LKPWLSPNRGSRSGRRQGLGCGDLVKNRVTKQPFNTKSDKMAGKPLMVGQVAAAMMKNGRGGQFVAEPLRDCAALNH
jgi:hypothetical protein